MTVAEFDRAFPPLRGPLTSYLFRLTTDRQLAEDLAQDTYIKARSGLPGFQGNSTLKTWVFAIATNLARDAARVKKRWHEDTQDRCREETQADGAKVAHMLDLVASSPSDRYDFKEHVDYCFTCITKVLTLEQQVVLVLKEVYGFRIADIMQIVGLTEGKVKHALTDSRRLMTEIFDRRCTLVSKKGVCHQCSEMSGFVNPKQDARQAALQLEIVREAESGAAPDRLLALRLELVRHVDPLNLTTPIHEYLLGLMDETVDG